ncbi:hypothetical protein ABZ348_20965 [Streptomyces sp. NPDC005963]|uniref:hypothetical protein n=1 Tax=Streptomyces sp. NPDC005963 TaxID=3156721 RepID=UPI0033EB4934
MGPYFFISHAIDGGGRQYVEQFLTDLQGELRTRLGREAQFDGVLADRQRRAAVSGGASEVPEAAGLFGLRGADVPPSTPAMACRALVVLYTVEYFRSPCCTFDLSVFSERMGWRSHRTGDAALSPVNVVWDTAGLPARWVEEAGRLAGPAGSDYPRRGLGHLVRDPAARGGYLKVVRNVAERVAGAALHPPPVMTVHDVDYLTQFTTHSRMPAFSWDNNPAPLQVPWQSGSIAAPSPSGIQEHGAHSSGAFDSGQQHAMAQRRSWFSSPEEGERPILRGPHS